MKKLLAFYLIMSFGFLLAQSTNEFAEDKNDRDKDEFTFIGYYFIRSEASNVAPTNEFLKGQVVGRLFGGNTTVTGKKKLSSYTEQRFIPLIAYSPRLFDGWAKMRMSFEFDWTWGDANYGAGGNFGGGFGADFVNMQTQNLFIEFRPQKNLFINAGLTRLFDNINVPSYTFTNVLVNTGYRLAFWGSDATGIASHYLLPNQRFKAGVYQLYENNVDHNDDVIFHEFDYEYDLDIVNSIGFSFWYLKDRANGEGGVSILGQGLSSGLSNYNGVFNFNFGNESYKADVFWLGSHFHGNPLLNQGRFGYSGFGIMNFGSAVSKSHDVDIMGYAGNLRLAYKYGKNSNDFVALDGVFSTGDTENIEDGKYTGILTGNNWTAPGAVFFSHGLYLLLPHGNVVNRFNAAVIDIQNVGYGLTAASLTGSYDIIPNKFKAKIGLGSGLSNVSPFEGGNMVGSEINLNLLYRPKVFMDLELHLAYLKLGDFFDSPLLNGDRTSRPEDPWTAFVTMKWIMF
ncbi:MAG: hypothetical protein D8M58_11620 [Calditrichaeota bacterium]|nr:MAG: hypothetical protein DWQ03_10995 [Calditrichota bacterium]MBL1206043.1 hypothetical protein [Calditrichota bacterium]NOG45871.1 hypothetical protein [Calditrichota bacterium]